MKKIKNKISLCTVSMNRFDHLKRTLPVNINDNDDYEQIEFVILDYNSNDQLESFIKNNFSDLIKLDKLKYFKTTSPNYFNRSHSRNLIFRLATGNILCNIDADNFTGRGFATYVNTQFLQNENIFLTPIAINSCNRQTDILGRICVKKDDFHKVRGYDESFIGYGFEDFDFANRLEKNGLNRILIDDATFLSALPHPTSIRIANEFLMKNFCFILISQRDAWNTKVLILFKNYECQEFHLEDLNSYERFCTSISVPLNTSIILKMFTGGGFSEVGTWKRDGNDFLIHSKSNGFVLSFLDNSEYYKIIDHKKLDKYCMISDQQIIEKIILKISLLQNGMVTSKNKVAKHNKVNSNGYGLDSVSKNFDTSKLITLNRI